MPTKKFSESMDLVRVTGSTSVAQNRGTGLVQDGPQSKLAPNSKLLPQTEELELLAFRVAGEDFAVQLHHVTEIVVPPPITRVPRTAAHHIGICSIRGQLAHVLDLRTLLALKGAQQRNKRRILLGPNKEDLIGLMVDEVHQVVRLPSKIIEAAAQSLGGEFSDAVAGIGRPNEGEMLVILDMPTLLERQHILSRGQDKQGGPS